MNKRFILVVLVLIVLLSSLADAKRRRRKKSKNRVTTTLSPDAELNSEGQELTHHLGNGQIQVVNPLTGSLLIWAVFLRKDMNQPQLLMAPIGAPEPENNISLLDTSSANTTTNSIAIDLTETPSGISGSEFTSTTSSDLTDVTTAADHETETTTTNQPDENTTINDHSEDVTTGTDQPKETTATDQPNEITTDSDHSSAGTTSTDQPDEVPTTTNTAQSNEATPVSDSLPVTATATAISDSSAGTELPHALTSEDTSDAFPTEMPAVNDSLVTSSPLVDETSKGLPKHINLIALWTSIGVLFVLVTVLAGWMYCRNLRRRRGGYESTVLYNKHHDEQ